MTRCPSCACMTSSNPCHPCHNCGYKGVISSEEVRLKRKAVDLINKNPRVAKKVVDFLGIRE